MDESTEGASQWAIIRLQQRVDELEGILEKMGIRYDKNQNLWRSSEHDALVDRLKHSLAAAIEARNWYADKVHQMMRDNDAV